MGRTLSETNDDKDEKDAKKPEKDIANDNDTDTETDSDEEANLDEEHFIVEKIVKMRTTKKGKVQCKLNTFVKHYSHLFLQIY